jgi:hypothetical protein
MQGNYTPDPQIAALLAQAQQAPGFDAGQYQPGEMGEPFQQEPGATGNANGMDQGMHPDPGAMMMPVGQDSGGPPQTFEPYDAWRLLQMFTAWQSAKPEEINEAFRATQYYHGKQWTAEEIKVLQDRSQPITTYNKIRKAVEGLVGVVEDMQGDPQALPRKAGNKAGADIATQSLRFVEDSTQFQSLKLEVARDGFRTGIGCVYITLRKKRGQIWHEKRYIDPAKFFYDPRSERLDFSDARYMGQHGWFDEDSLIELLPSAKDQIENLIGAGSTSSVEAGGGFAGTPQQSAKEHTWVDGLRRRIYVVEIWYLKGGMWAYAFVCGNVKLAEGVSPFWNADEDKSMQPFVPWSCYMDDRLDRYGVIRDMFSPQDEVNKRRSKSLHLLSVRQTKAVKGAVDDVAKMKRELAKPDGHVEVNPNADFEVLSTNDQLQGHFELLKEAKGEIEALGPNPNIIGRGNQDQSGIALQEQKAAAMKEHGPVFKQFLQWKLRVYKHDFALVKQFWTDERMIRITDAETGDAQHIPLNQPVPPGMMMGHNGGPPMDAGQGQMQQPPMSPMGPGGPPMPQQMGGQTQQPNDPKAPPAPMISQGPDGRAILNAIGEIDVDIIMQEGQDLPNDEAVVRQKLLEIMHTYGPDKVPFEMALKVSGLPFREQKELMAIMEKAKQPDPMRQQMEMKAAQMHADKLQGEIDKLKADTKAAEASALSNIAKAEQTFAATQIQNLEPQFRQAEAMLAQQRAGLDEKKLDQAFQVAQMDNQNAQQGLAQDAEHKQAALAQKAPPAPGTGPQPQMPPDPMGPMGLTHRAQPGPEMMPPG